MFTSLESAGSKYYVVAIQLARQKEKVYFDEFSHVSFVKGLILIWAEFTLIIEICAKEQMFYTLQIMKKC